MNAKQLAKFEAELKSLGLPAAKRAAMVRLFKIEDLGNATGSDIRIACRVYDLNTLKLSTGLRAWFDNAFFA